MKVTSPKWVKKASQWCVTTVESSGANAKHALKYTQYWFSTKEEAMAKEAELCIKNEPKNS